MLGRRDTRNDTGIAPYNLLVGFNDAHRVQHSRRRQRIRPRQPGKITGIPQWRMMTSRYAMVKALNLRAVPLRLGKRIGHDAHQVQSKLFGAPDVAFRLHPVIAAKRTVRCADMLGSKLHQDRDARHKVHRLTPKHGRVALFTSHGVHESCRREPARGCK
jgi:hypothetical protein